MFCARGLTTAALFCLYFVVPRITLRFRYGVSEMQEMFRHLPPALPNGVDTDCPVVLSLPETVLEQDRPDGERRCSIELEKRRAGARISTGTHHVEGIKEEGDVLAEAAAAVAEVEQSSPAADSAAAASPTSAPRSYASLVRRSPALPHHLVL